MNKRFKNFKDQKKNNNNHNNITTEITHQVLPEVTVPLTAIPVQPHPIQSQQKNDKRQGQNY